MKHLSLGILLLIAMTSCHKLGSLNPKNGINNQLTIDTSIHHVILDIGKQYVTTQVSGDTLKMVYSENVNVLVRAKGFDQSWAVHLIEDFGKSALNDFDYTTVTQDGNITFDWVDDNLNNVVLKTVSDTTISGVNLIKINVKRPFAFSKVFADNQSAINAQQALINRGDDTINFSSYIYFVDYFPTSTVSAKIAFK